MSTLISGIEASVASARKEWGWFLVLGICLTVLGIISIAYEGVATLASIFALGIVLIVAGIMQIAAAFQTRGAGHVILYLLLGVLDIVVGLALLAHPVAGALTVTLVLAVYFVFGGIFRIVYALWSQLPQSGWAVFSGLVAIVLGVLLWEQWPTSAIWFLGLAVGVNFIFAGVSWMALAFKLRSA